MKKFRKIEIKNPKLQKIRNEFRKLIFIASKENEQEIEDKKWAITTTPNGSLREGITDKDWEEVGKLNGQYWAIESPLRRSIVECNICHELESDRIYYPETGEWYCPECYDKFYVHPEQLIP